MHEVEFSTQRILQCDCSDSAFPARRAASPMMSTATLIRESSAR
jgi:hypothetical protein